MLVFERCCRVGHSYVGPIGLMRNVTAAAQVLLSLPEWVLCFIRVFAGPVKLVNPYV